MNDTPPFAILQLTTSPVKLHQCLVNVFSQPGMKLQQNDGLNNIGNLAAWNSTKVEEVDNSELLEYKDMLTVDRDFEEWDKTVEGEIIIVA